MFTTAKAGRSVLAGVTTTRYFAPSAIISTRVSKLVALALAFVTRSGCPGIASTSIVFGAAFSPGSHISIADDIFVTSGMVTFSINTAGSRTPLVVTRIDADCAPYVHQC